LLGLFESPNRKMLPTNSEKSLVVLSIDTSPHPDILLSLNRAFFLETISNTNKSLTLLLLFPSRCYHRHFDTLNQLLSKAYNFLHGVVMQVTSSPLFEMNIVMRHYSTRVELIQQVQQVSLTCDGVFLYPADEVPGKVLFGITSRNFFI
jgi:hypothetical protein